MGAVEICACRSDAAGQGDGVGRGRGVECANRSHGKGVAADGDLMIVKDLTTKIRAFITGWNTRCVTFVWTKAETKYSPRQIVGIPTSN